ncbi:MAG TPA: class I SAM-dependent methyltransferase [Acidimicrobiales bacterium]|nr:class I SAM-dependent methyltransferase [Acidimicrobiales bacterium]
MESSGTGFDGRAYQARIEELIDQGIDIHGEAKLILSYSPTSILDAGCGTGRIAIELARHGVEVVGVDKDESMISEARRISPKLCWIEADLSSLDLDQIFDIVVLAGNVPLFCPEPDRSALIAHCAAHLVDNGLLIAGFQLNRGYSVSEFDNACRVANLLLVERWATWNREPFLLGSDYVVSVLRFSRSREIP